MKYNLLFICIILLVAQGCNYSKFEKINGDFEVGETDIEVTRNIYYRQQGVFPGKYVGEIALYHNYIVASVYNTKGNNIVCDSKNNYAINMQEYILDPTQENSSGIYLVKDLDSFICNKNLQPIPEQTYRAHRCE